MGDNIFDLIRRNSIEKVKDALQTGIDVTERNERQETPLLACVMYLKDLESARHMINSGADVNDQNERGQTALIYGCILNKLQIVTTLLEQNDLDVNKTDSDGNTALMYACALGHTDAVSRLFQSHELGEHTLDLDIKNNDNMTALDHATDRGHVNVIKLFANFNSEKKEVSPETPKENNWIEMKPMTEHHSPQTQKTRQNSRENIQKTIDKVRKDSLVDKPKLSLNIARPLEPTITVTAPGEESHTVVSFDDEVSPTTRQKRIPKSPTKQDHTPDDSGTELEYEDFSLESLGDLIKTVRQCAQEIREIQIPLKEPIFLTPPRPERKRKEKKGKEGGKLRAKNTALKADAILLEIPETPRARPMTLSDEEKCVGDTDVLSQTWPRQKDVNVDRRGGQRSADLFVKRSVSMSPHQTPAKTRQKPPTSDDKNPFSRMIDRITNRKHPKQSASLPSNIDRPSTSGMQDARIQIPSVHESISKQTILSKESTTKMCFENPGYHVEVIPPAEPSTLERRVIKFMSSSDGS